MAVTAQPASAAKNLFPRAAPTAVTAAAAAVSMLSQTATSIRLWTTALRGAFLPPTAKTGAARTASARAATTWFCVCPWARRLSTPQPVKPLPTLPSTGKRSCLPRAAGVAWGIFTLRRVRTEHPGRQHPGKRVSTVNCVWNLRFLRTWDFLECPTPVSPPLLRRFPTPARKSRTIPLRRCIRISGSCASQANKVL